MIVPHKEYRVFLSSTAKGYAEIRNSIAAAFDRMDGFRLVRYENFSASPKGGIERCLNEIEQADLFLLICGPFLGTLEPNGISVVEKEYQKALEEDKNCLVFVANSDFKICCGDVENDQQREQLKQFKNRLDSKHYRDSFADGGELIHKVTTATSNWRISMEEPKGFKAIKTLEGPKIDIDMSGPGVIRWGRNNNTNQFEITASDGPIFLRGIRFEADGQKIEYSFISKLPKGASFYRASSANIIDTKGDVQIVGSDTPRFTERGLLIEPQRTNHAPPVVDKNILPHMTQTFGFTDLSPQESFMASVIGGDCLIQQYEADLMATSEEDRRLRFLDEVSIKNGSNIAFKIRKNYEYGFLFKSEEPMVHVQLESGKFATSPIPTIKTDKDYFIQVTRARDILLIDM